MYLVLDVPWSCFYWCLWGADNGVDEEEDGEEGEEGEEEEKGDRQLVGNLNLSRW